MDAIVCSKAFALPPYKAEAIFNLRDIENNHGYGVVNRNGFNCLSFTSKTGATFTDKKSAELIASQWNEQATHAVRRYIPLREIR